MGLRAGSQGGFEPCSDLFQYRLEWDVVDDGIDDEELARLRLGPPGSVEADQVPPRIRGPHRQHAYVVRCGLEVVGYTRRHVAVGEQRLRVACGHEVELPVVVEL